LLAFVFFLGSSVTPQNKSSNRSASATNKPNCCALQVGCSKDGKDGKDGQNGKDGRDGINGRNGRDGKIGAKGDKGDTGLRGLNGNAGVKGEKGEPGLPRNDGNFSTKVSSLVPYLNQNLD